MDTHTEWNDIYDGSLLWKEIHLNTEVVARPPAGRKQGNVSALRVLTFDVPLAWKTVPGWPESFAWLLHLAIQGWVLMPPSQNPFWPHYLQWPTHFPFILFNFLYNHHSSIFPWLLTCCFYGLSLFPIPTPNLPICLLLLGYAVQQDNY